VIRTVLIEDVTDGVRVITLNRPERLNAISSVLLRELNAALKAADQDPSVRAVVLTGAGRAFCSGDDLKEFAEQLGDEPKVRAYVEAIQDITRAIVLGETPVIGAIRGWAVGGGLEWVINCDFAIAAEGTRFFFPEMSWGLFITGAAASLLPRLVGLQRARELIMLGERFDALQALQWGMLWKVVPAAQLMTIALALAEKIAALPPGPIRDLKRILSHHATATLPQVMAAETDATVRGFLDPETSRRIARFS
jgi:enoyl-CoA hydratase/carnithine racemase